MWHVFMAYGIASLYSLLRTPQLIRWNRFFPESDSINMYTCLFEKRQRPCFSSCSNDAVVWHPRAPQRMSLSAAGIVGRPVLKATYRRISNIANISIWCCCCCCCYQCRDLRVISSRPALFVSLWWYFIYCVKRCSNVKVTHSQT